MLPNPGEWQVILLTLKVATLAVMLAFPAALLAGWLMAAGTRLAMVIAVLANIPLVLPPVVTGWLLLTVLGGQGAIGAWLQAHAGLTLPSTTAGAVLACAVMAFPFMARAIRLGVQAADQDVLAMAQSLGAAPMDRFLAVALPLAAPGLLLALVTGFTASAGQFGAVIIFAANVPGQTQTLPLAIYTALQTPDGAAAAARLALASLTLAVLGALTAEALTRRLRATTASA
jgi:molybdate transport system permease protein